MGRLIGQPVRCFEDQRLVRGAGRFVSDIDLPGTLEVAFLRSPHAHARILSVSKPSALALLGVVTVVTGDDLADRGVDAAAKRANAPYPLLAQRTVHYIGEPIVAIVAESRYIAEDACDAVRIEYEVLPAVTTIADSVAGVTLVRDDVTSNVAVQKVVGYGDVQLAFQEAEVVLEEEFYIARASAHPLETRSILAAPDPATNGLIVWSGTQLPHVVRRYISALLGLPERDIRVIVPDVGGAFGSKSGCYPEELLVPYLARVLSRPVRWVEDRREHFIATQHEREQRHRIRLAARKDGALLAVDDTFWMDFGAYCAWPHMLERTAFTLPGPYHLPNYRCEAHAVLTHKTPAGPYRGAGRPQGNYVMERMIDRLAEATGLDPAEVRRRNFIAADQLPYTTPLGVTYDSGNYQETLEKALELLRYDYWRQEQAKARASGRYLGIGLSCYIEDTGSAGPYEGASLRLESDGSITIYSGAPSSGQNHETIFSQVVAERLGLPLERVRVIATDTGHPSLGLGTFGSRTAGIAVSAVQQACVRLEQRLKELASQILEAPAADLEIADVAVHVRGAPTRRVSFEQIARLGNWVSLLPLPPGVEPGVEATAYFRGRAQYGNGSHACLVEVDSSTGQVRVLAYIVVHDCGTLLNPTVVTGQVHGGVSHGISTVLLEELRYDRNGQLLTATYLDYLLPLATDLPNIVVEHVEYPSPFTPTGAKGAGEGGTIPALACVANAVEDALRPLHVRLRELPLSPSRLQAAIDAAQP